MVTGPVNRRLPNLYERAHRRLVAGRYLRLKEAAFFGVPGAGIVLLAYGLYQGDFMNAPLSLLLGLVGVVYAFFGVLPPIPKPEVPVKNPKSRRR